MDLFRVPPAPPVAPPVVPHNFYYDSVATVLVHETVLPHHSIDVVEPERCSNILVKIIRHTRYELVLRIHVL